MKLLYGIFMLINSSFLDLEVFNGSESQVEYVSTVAHRVILYQDSNESSLNADNSVQGAKVIQVQECNRTNGVRIKNNELDLEYVVPKNPVWF